MDFGIPRETRIGEQRAALTPSGVKALVSEGHQVWVETGAGARAGFADAEYETCGATIAYARDELFARADVIAAVFAPEAREFHLLRPDHVVLAFWMLP